MVEVGKLQAGMASGGKITDLEKEVVALRTEQRIRAEFARDGIHLAPAVVPPQALPVVAAPPPVLPAVAAPLPVPAAQARAALVAAWTTAMIVAGGEYWDNTGSADFNGGWKFF